MRLRWSCGACAVVAAAVAVLSAGCSDDKGSGSNNLTTEDQYETITEYFTFDPNNASSQLDVTGYVLGLLSGQYWDGVDTADFGGVANRVVPSGKRTADDLDSLYVDYNFVTNWWVIYYRISVPDGSFDFALRDSVRYHSSGGDFQIQPDETTDRIDLRQHLSANVSGASEGLAAHQDDHFELGTSSDSRFTITKISAVLAQVDGLAGVNLDLDASENDTSAVIGMNLQAEYTALEIPIAAWDSEPCPTGGEVSAGMDISVSVEAGDETAEAEGSWDASIDFTGNGTATVGVESGDFSREYTGSVCTPPSE